jgi:hypothetical protein
MNSSLVPTRITAAIERYGDSCRRLGAMLARQDSTKDDIIAEDKRMVRRYQYLVRELIRWTLSQERAV